MSTPSQTPLRVMEASEQRVLRYVDALCEGVAQEMDRDPRVFQVGTFLLSSLERVFYQRDGAKPADGVRRGGYRPEIG